MQDRSPSRSPEPAHEGHPTRRKIRTIVELEKKTRARRGRAFDPFPFSLLTVVVALEAILLAGFVLMQQALMREEADRRAHLDLQVNVVAEQELTAILRVVYLLAERTGIDLDRSGADLEFVLAPTDLQRSQRRSSTKMDAGERARAKE